MTREFDQAEIFNAFNRLTGLAQCLENKNILIDLRNETSVAGTIIHVDGYMNISMENVVYIDQTGQQFPMDNFMVYAKYVRYIHIPKEMNVKHALEEHIKSRTQHPKKQPKKRTFKTKRAQENQLRTLAENDML